VPLAQSLLQSHRYPKLLLLLLLPLVITQVAPSLLRLLSLRRRLTLPALERRMLLLLSPVTIQQRQQQRQRQATAAPASPQGLTKQQALGSKSTTAGPSLTRPLAQPNPSKRNDIFAPTAVTEHAAAAANRAQVALSIAAAKLKSSKPAPEPQAQPPPFSGQYDYTSPVKEQFTMKAPQAEAVTGVPPAWTAEGQVTNAKPPVDPSAPVPGKPGDVMVFDPVKDLAPPQVTDSREGTVMGNKVGAPLMDLGISKAFNNQLAKK
jgi:hypothetical protein